MSFNAPSSVDICAECEEKSATVWCENCRVCLCSKCSEDLHKGKTQLKHERVPISQKPLPPVSCARHKSENIKLWCENDENLLCQLCFSVEHSNHAIKTVEDAATIKINEIEENISNVQTKLNDHLDCGKPYTSITTKIRTVVTQTFVKLRNMLNTKETELIKQIDAIEQQNKSAFDQHQNLLNGIKSSLEGISKEIQKMLTPRNPIEIMKNHKQLRDRIKKIDYDVTGVKMPRQIRVEVYGIWTLADKLIELMTLMTLGTPGLPQIPPNATWSQNATTIITGLSNPHGLDVDQDDGTVYVADAGNKRIISWNPNTNQTNVIVSNLGWPTDVLIDKETNSIIIADYNSKRVLRCSLENGKNQVETIIDNIGCHGLTMDNEGSLYVCDRDKHEVRKFPRGEKTGILVAGGNGKGNGNHQLSNPHYIALDDEGSLYVSDWNNHRVMKWKKEAKEGITVAGGNGEGSNNNQLYYPQGIVVDSNGNIYVAEEGNNRVTRWRKGEKTGEILAGGKGQGSGMNQFNIPVGLSFDRQNNLYVADFKNNRVQRFSLK